VQRIRSGSAGCAAERNAKIVFEGAINQDRICEFYAAADVFCPPIFAEGLPVALTEAMAMELPCVTTCFTGIPELVRSGVDGLMVPPSDLAALMTAPARLMDDANLPVCEIDAPLRAHFSACQCHLRGIVLVGSRR
jgi:glycosyltransferase involved in cell wall biosynthesis